VSRIRGQPGQVRLVFLPSLRGKTAHVVITVQGAPHHDCGGVLYAQSLSLLTLYSSLRNINVDNGFLSSPY
jgi:hypothetical protein